MTEEQIPRAEIFRDPELNLGLSDELLAKELRLDWERVPPNSWEVFLGTEWEGKGKRFVIGGINSLLLGAKRKPINPKDDEGLLNSLWSLSKSVRKDGFDRAFDMSRVPSRNQAVAVMMVMTRFLHAFSDNPESLGGFTDVKLVDNSNMESVLMGIFANGVEKRRFLATRHNRFSMVVYERFRAAVAD